jgi:hypothetical protein
MRRSLVLDDVKIRQWPRQQVIFGILNKNGLDLDQPFICILSAPSEPAITASFSAKTKNKLRKFAK